MPLGWPRRVRTNIASRCSAGPASNSIRCSQPSPPTSSRIGSSRTRTPARSSAARSPFRLAPDRRCRARRRCSSPRPPAPSARAAGPEPWTASDRSRTSQPSQNGQWKTDRPQSRLDARAAAAGRSAARARAPARGVRTAPPSSLTAKPSDARVGVEHLAVPDLDVREAGQLLAAGAAAGPRGPRASAPAGRRSRSRRRWRAAACRAPARAAGRGPAPGRCSVRRGRRRRSPRRARARALRASACAPRRRSAAWE